MFRRVLRVTGVELYKLAHRRAAYVLVALLLLVVAGRAVGVANEIVSDRQRTGELNAFLVFAHAADAGLFTAALLLLLYASAAFAGETSLGTLKALLVRPVTRTEFVLGKALTLAVAALGLGGLTLAAAAAAGAALSDYTGVLQVSHNIRTTGLLVTDHEVGNAAQDPPDLRRLGFTGRWDEAHEALRVEHVLPGSLAEQRDIRDGEGGDIVTHAGAGDAEPRRLDSLDGWRRWVAALPDGVIVTLTLDAPSRTETRDFTRAYLADETRRALLLLPLPLVAVVCFGLLWSSLSDSLGPAVGGALLSYFAIRFVLGAVVVGVARAVSDRPLFIADVERHLFTTWLGAPLVKLQGAAAATSNKQILDDDVRYSTITCAATALACVAVILWRYRRKDVLG